MTVKKISLLCFLLAITYYCRSQENDLNRFTYENFDKEILNYQPIKKDPSKKSFPDGLHFLEETKKRVLKNKKMDVTDYWNILTALDRFNESSEKIDIAFSKFLEADGSCEYIVSFEKYFKRYNEYFQSKLVNQLKICSETEKLDKKEGLDILEYSRKGGFDKNLITLINSILINDQQDRSNQKTQMKLDDKNQKKIDSLYSIHKSYIGKTLVGDKFEDVMWLVIQHSNLQYMEKYLPVVSSAVKNNELNEMPLKYLIDRIHSIKYNHQIFGSQMDIKIADEKTRNKIKAKYKIE